MQALSRTSIGWDWSVMVYLNTVTTVLWTLGNRVGQVLLSCKEEGGIAVSRACMYVCVRFVCTCV